MGCWPTLDIVGAPVSNHIRILVAGGTGGSKGLLRGDPSGPKGWRAVAGDNFASTSCLGFKI